MGLEILGVKSTLVKLRRTERTTTKQLLRHMRESARDIRDLARDYAPVDEGNLEEAIEVVESKEGFFGHNRNIELVGVNPAKLGEGYTKYKERYDVLMHEGVYDLGPRSQKKAATGKDVGPKYLTRAWRDLEPDITAKAKRIAAETVRSS